MNKMSLATYTNSKSDSESLSIQPESAMYKMFFLNEWSYSMCKYIGVKKTRFDFAAPDFVMHIQYIILTSNPLQQNFISKMKVHCHAWVSWPNSDRQFVITVI
jgi:hypothetical protein